MSDDDVAVRQTLVKCLAYLAGLSVAVYLIRRYSKSMRQRFIAWLLNRFIGSMNKSVHKEKIILFSTIENDKRVKILEIGAGSGANFEFYPKRSEVTCLEPNPYCKDYLENNAPATGIQIKTVVQGFAENMSGLGLKDNSFDVIVCTLVLCSVRDVDRVLFEVKRVLKPGGKFYFMEHILDDNRLVRRIQKILNPLWWRMVDGCQLIRDTPVYIKNAGFDEVKITKFKYPYFLWPFFVKKFCFGTATKF